MKKIFVAGHNGMVGRAICRRLHQDQSVQVLTRDRLELDLQNPIQVQEFMTSEQPDEVIIAAAKVGGILANNTYPAEFIFKNLQIQNNLIHMSHLANVQKLLFLGSSCIYPRNATQPMREDDLLSGTLEPTNEPYAIAKIAGIKMCESYNRQYGRDYRSVMPTNLYGPGDNYDLKNSHVVPALIRRFHEAKIQGAETVEIWGTGTPKREFLYVDDMADASLYVHNLSYEQLQNCTQPMLSHINIGSGHEITIKELVKKISSIIEYKGKVAFDRTKPDGPPRKLLNIDKIKSMGWKSETDLENGLKKSYIDYLSKISL